MRTVTILLAAVVILLPIRKSAAITYFSPPTSIVQNGDFALIQKDQYGVATNLTHWSFSGSGHFNTFFEGGADGGAFIQMASLYDPAPFPNT